MSDPYKALGVSPSATDEEVKEAYRSLAKKYHPDQYADSPLKELADEKMKEINEAYDAITAQRKAGSGQGRAGGYGYNNVGAVPPWLAGGGKRPLLPGLPDGSGQRRIQRRFKPGHEPRLWHVWRL